MKRALILCLVTLSCACPKSSTTAGGGSGGSGSGTRPVDKPDPAVTSCESAKSKVAGLYRAEGMKGKDAGRIDAFVDDNTTMVMADCAKQPAKLVPCLASAQTVADIETRCLEPLDDEGTEGDTLRR